MKKLTAVLLSAALGLTSAASFAATPAAVKAPAAAPQAAQAKADVKAGKTEMSKVTAKKAEAPKAAAKPAAKPAVAADKKPVRAVCTERIDAGSTDLVKGERAVFCFENSTGVAEIKRPDIGSNAYVADDHTVSKTGSSIAGEVIDIDDAGVWVAIGTAAVPTTA